VLLWWAPTPATRDPALALILIALLATATEALRRKIAREHPDADMSESIERLRERARQGVAWVRQGSSRAVTHARTATPGGSSNGDRIERLERIGRLKETGVLDEQEFAAQKRLILEESGDVPEPDNGAPAPTALAPPPPLPSGG
jgi:hypothetical protein